MVAEGPVPKPPEPIVIAQGTTQEEEPVPLDEDGLPPPVLRPPDERSNGSEEQTTLVVKPQRSPRIRPRGGWLFYLVLVTFLAILAAELGDDVSAFFLVYCLCFVEPLLWSMASYRPVARKPKAKSEPKASQRRALAVVFCIAMMAIFVILFF